VGAPVTGKKRLISEIGKAARCVAAAGGTIGLVNDPDRVVFRVELGATG
jgi:hypothetical protein